MKRTQIYIDENIYNILERESHLKNKSVSELIRKSLFEKMDNKVEDIIKKTDNVFGIWKDKKVDAEEYIRTVRKDRKLW